MMAKTEYNGRHDKLASNISSGECRVQSTLLLSDHSISLTSAGGLENVHFLSFLGPGLGLVVPRLTCRLELYPRNRRDPIGDQCPITSLCLP